jgi:hypothetical protein
MAMSGTWAPVANSRRRIFLGGLESVQNRHLDVHQDDVKPFPIERLDGLGPVANDRHPVAAVFQNPHGQLLVDDVVFRKQDGIPASDWLSEWRVINGVSAR